MALTRREFLQKSGCALGAGAMTLAFERFGLVNAFAQAEDYKALVCVFLNGGNDSNNVVIPYDNYAEYAAVRDSGGNVQIPQGSLLVIDAPSTGAQFGLHPSVSGLHELYGQGKVAVVCNVGPLVEPTTREAYRNNTARRPTNLFSHSDQQIQWQTSIAGAVSQTGWGGRVADRMAILNPPGGFPITVSVAGITLFSIGRTTRPLGLAPGVSLSLEGISPGDARYEALVQLLGVDTVATLVAATSEITLQAVNNSQVLASLPDVTTTFPNTNLGNQLRQVARLIKLNQTAPLNLKRQLFFCSLGGFDLHSNQVVAGNPTTGNHANLWTQVSGAMRAFYDATVELGVENNVTSFTLSDFSRTFKPNGNTGTDHGWGAHHFVMGGSVLGGDFYGLVGPNGTVFPSLVLGDSELSVDTDAGAGARGRWVPTVAVDQYAATLALWYGVSSSDIPAIFPNSADGRFDPLDLGFLG
jgi:uncharacterized protein (DUF1501 family)